MVSAPNSLPGIRQTDHPNGWRITGPYKTAEGEYLVSVKQQDAVRHYRFRHHDGRVALADAEDKAAELRGEADK